MVIIIRRKKFRWSLRKFLTNCAVCLMVLVVFGLYLTNAVKATSENSVSTLTVRRGETLWSIARRIAPEKDPRDVIAKLKEANQLQDSCLKTGQTLKIIAFD
ncbi:MAG: LysM peptidoglycan-binding domain-containing protein [Firmicutes bacterium]|nr:LysM peptidoglycan-binding domain-containing protein [Bacillota bacterium]